MVSPSKIFKTSNSGFNVGIIGSKKNGLRAQRDSKQRLSSSSNANSYPRFLSNTRFYLDIRNRLQLDKVKAILNSYGAKIEVFFRKDVKLIVTDKLEWMGSVHSPSSSVSPLTTPSPSTNQDQRFSVPKSRASAMLEKVSQQPTSYSSLLELAQKWRIPICPVRNLITWIARVEESYLTKLNEKKKEKVLESEIVLWARDKAPFIKIESIFSRNKPEFSELDSWPRLNLDGYLGQCPFRKPRPHSSTTIASVQEPNKVETNLFEGNDKVAVELIQYNTEFRFKNNLTFDEGCEEVAEGEQPRDASENQDRSNCSLTRVGSLACKMTRRPVKNNAVGSEEEASKIASTTTTTTTTDCKQNLSLLCNGHTSRNITRQSSQELLKVQCNGLTTSHRNSKLLSPSGSDVLPLPSSRRSTRRASASWCGSTRELSQLSPTDSEIENIRRSDSSFEGHDPSLDTAGITLRPKGQLWLPIALIGTTAEENGNSIRKRYDYSIRQSMQDNAKLSAAGDPLVDSSSATIDVKPVLFEGDGPDEGRTGRGVPRDPEGHQTNCSSEYPVKRTAEKRDSYCIVTRNTKVKNEEMNGGRPSRESSPDGPDSDSDPSKMKKRSLSVCDRVSGSVKRTRTMSANSNQSGTVGRRKKLSPEEKLLQDNKDYFKMEVLNTKLRSTGSLLNLNQGAGRDSAAGSVTNGPCGTKSSPATDVEKTRDADRKSTGGGGGGGSSSSQTMTRRRRKKWGRTAKLTFATGDLAGGRKKAANLKINGVIRKKRQTELMKLCNEAESFMFGESTRTSTNGYGDESHDESSSSSPSPRKKACVKGSNGYQDGATGSESAGKTRKKRRSHAEAFIHDNLDYYKFETPGSRLRYQGNNFVDVKSEDKDFIYTLKQKRKEWYQKRQMSKRLASLPVEVKEEKVEKRNPVKPSEVIEKILFSFESIPSTEPWYAVYKRQDEGLENYYPLLSNPNDQPFLLPYEMPKPVCAKVPAVSEYYKRRRKKLVHLFNHPRKSPRCHASTLAILSSLKKRKRRSGGNISMNNMLAEASSPPPQVTPLSSSGPVTSATVPSHLQSPIGSPRPYDTRQSDAAKADAETEEILNFLYNDEADVDADEVFLEPFSDSEGQPRRKNSDSSGRSGKSDDVTVADELTRVTTKTSGRGCKKLPAGESVGGGDQTTTATESFGGQDWTGGISWQTIDPDDFLKDMVIETRKKSGPMVNITTILEEYKNCRSMEEPEGGDLAGSAGSGNSGRSPDGRGTGVGRGRRKKARKINKTGWDNRKSRRRTGVRLDAKETECGDAGKGAVRARSSARVKIRSSVTTDNIIRNGTRKSLRRAGASNSSSSGGGSRKSDADTTRSAVRSHINASEGSAKARRNSRDTEGRSASLDSAAAGTEYPPCVVRIRKMTDTSVGSGTSVRLRYTRGRPTLQRRRLVLSRKKKRVIDYAWTSRKR